jgi:hypothetical protein
MTHTLVLAFAVTAFSPAALAQGTPADMSKQMARFGGVMHATAKACDDHTEQELAAMKQQQKAMHGQSGLDASTFDQVFADGEREGVQKWQSMSPAQRADACKKIQQQAAAASQYGQ